MNKKRSFIIGALLLALPNIMQNLVTNLAGLADNLMVGGLQEHAIAGVAITNQLVFVVTIVLFGVGSAAGIFIPQYKGIGDEAKMTAFFKVSLVLSFAIGLFSFLLTLFFPNSLLSMFATEYETLYEARQYLFMLQFSFLLLPISLAIGNAYRFCGHVKLPMYFALLAVGINIILNYGLIHGNLGMPALGVTGAALGTVISRIIELLAFLISTIIIKSPVKIQITSLLKLEKSLYSIYLKKGYGLVLNEFFWAFGMQAITVIYTMRISENIAAMSISRTFANLMFVGIGGMATVFSIYLGEHLGRNDFKNAQLDALRLKKIASCLGLSIGIVVLIISQFLIDFYEVSDHIKQMAMIILAVQVAFSWLYYLNASYFFILRSGGDTKSVFIIDSVYTWLIMIPLAFLIGLPGFALPIHFLIVQFFELIKLLLAHRLYKKGGWLNNLTTQ